MNDPSRLNVKVTSTSQPNRPKASKMVTLDSIKEWIKLQHLDSFTEEGLISLAGGYPTAALPSFRRNINLMIQRVRAKRQQEYGENNGNVQQEDKKANYFPTNLDEAFRLVKDGTIGFGTEPAAQVEAKYDPFDESSPVRVTIKDPEAQEESFD